MSTCSYPRFTRHSCSTTMQIHMVFEHDDRKPYEFIWQWIKNGYENQGPFHTYENRVWKHFSEHGMKTFCLFVLTIIPVDLPPSPTAPTAPRARSTYLQPTAPSYSTYPQHPPTAPTYSTFLQHLQHLPTAPTQSAFLQLEPALKLEGAPLSGLHSTYSILYRLSFPITTIMPKHQCP